jgi:hypothetical protein
VNFERCQDGAQEIFEGVERSFRIRRSEVRSRLPGAGKAIHSPWCVSSKSRTAGASLLT